MRPSVVLALALVLLAGSAHAASRIATRSGPAESALAARPSPSVLPQDAIARRYFGNDAPWYERNIPFFESSDPKIDQIYYYRWEVFRAHVRSVGQQGTLFTEFLQDMTWDRDPYSTLNDSAIFPIYDGRWLRNRSYLDDWIRYLWTGGGNNRHFSESIADATYQRYQVDGNVAFATSFLPSMEQTYNLWDDHYDFDKHLYWIEPLLDATEYSVASIEASGGKDGFRGGDAFRPSINSYMFANARAISRLAALAGDDANATRYAAKAADLQHHVEQDLWSPQLHHFIDRYKVDNTYVHYWDPIGSRELAGYTPWTFGLVSDAKYAVAWEHALDAKQLGSPHGLRTVEPSYAHYMQQYRYDEATGLRECQWNGPVWPFQSTQALIGLANLLNSTTQTVVTRSDYASLLKQYTDMHYVDGHPDIQEDYDPATGKPVVGLPRSHHYYHSAYDDLIITGLVGIRPRADNVLEVNPLVPRDAADPNALRWFVLENAPYHGHLITVLYDRDGHHYHGDKGLQLFIDGRKVASSPVLARLTAPIEQAALPAAMNDVDLAVNLTGDGFPQPSASTNGADKKRLMQSIDGRMWFFSEIQEGWSTKGAAAKPQWYALDFGAPVTIGASRIYFLDDGKSFAAPKSYVIQYFVDGSWRNISNEADEKPLANGVNERAWSPITARKFRVLLTPPAQQRAIRLLEWKLYDSRPAHQRIGAAAPPKHAMTIKTTEK